MGKRKVVKVLDYCMLFLLLAMVIYLWVTGAKYQWTAFAALLLAGWGCFVLIRYRMPGAKGSLRKIILLNDQEKPVKEWHITAEQGLVIGKSYQKNPVDIDLSETEYAVLIAKEHAVLNCAGGRWYLEDLGTRNGVGIKPKGQTKVKKLGDHEACEVRPGDRIYIAKAVLAMM